MHIYRLIILIIVTSITTGKSQDTPHPHVKISQGKIRGEYWKTYTGKTFGAYIGIPYAQPPVGVLRFQGPVPADKWDGILNATVLHHACPQINIYSKDYPIIGNEDCLYLNVYTSRVESSYKALLPVMVYIHGGTFVMGSARPDWLGPEIILDKEIVLVTINYRLGALGFLSTEDRVVSGNNGLKDQHLALEWVKNNINNFGGDSQSITIFGNSAGAASVHYHVLSPLSKDLITRAIIQSGTAISNWSLCPKGEAIRNARLLGKLLNCTNQSTKELVECLKGIDAYDMIRQESILAVTNNGTSIPFGPVIEVEEKNAYLTEHPLTILKAGNVSEIPLVIGMVKNEAAFQAAAINSKPEAIKRLSANFNAMASRSLGITPDATETVKQYYFKNNSIDNFTKSNLCDMYTDGWFLSGLDNTVRLHRKYINQSIFIYLFAYRGKESYGKLFGDVNYDYGVAHTDELLYLFSRNLTFPHYLPTKQDIKMRELMTALWTNFAKTGDPNLDYDFAISSKWEAVKTDNLEYFHIRNFDDMGMEEHLFPNRTRLWRGLQKTYGYLIDI